MTRADSWKATWWEDTSPSLLSSDLHILLLLLPFNLRTILVGDEGINMEVQSLETGLSRHAQESVSPRKGSFFIKPVFVSISSVYLKVMAF